MSILGSAIDSKESSSTSLRLSIMVLSVELEYSQIYTEGKKPFRCLQESLKVIKSDQITLSELLKPFIDRGYILDSHMFLYYSKGRGIYVYCGNSENADQTSVPLNDIENDIIQLRCRKTIEPSEKEFVKNSLNGNKVVKERKISEIIKKVTKWRKLYVGTVMSDGSTVRYSSKEAASIIGIAKKTLDDYLLQLRIGKKYGFDFNYHNDDKIGVLRSFVKEKKGRIRNDKNNTKSEDSSSVN